MTGEAIPISKLCIKKLDQNSPFSIEGNKKSVLYFKCETNNV